MTKFYTDGYRQFYTGSTEPDSDFDPDSSRYVRGERIFSFLKPELEKREYSSPKILDGGCGSGVFLHFFRNFFPSAELYGVEPDLGFAKYAETHTNAKIFYEDIAEFLNKSSQLHGSFDIITLNHVLEHLYDPLNKLKKIHQYLNKDGLLLVEVPNIMSEEWTAPIKAFHIAHISHFTPQTLRAAFKVAGFEVLREDLSVTGAMTFVCKKAASTEASAYSMPALTPEEKNSLEGFLESLHSRVTKTHRNNRALSLMQKIEGKAKKLLRAIHLSVKRRVYRRINHAALETLLKDKEVIITGPGESLKDGANILNSNSCIHLTSTGGIVNLAKNGIPLKADLCLLTKGKLSRNVKLQKLLGSLEAKFIISQNDSVNFSEFLTRMKSQPSFLTEFDTINYYLNKLTDTNERPFDSNESRYVSSEFKLLIYALYFGAKKVYLLGLNPGVKGSKWDYSDESSNPLNGDMKILKFLSEKKCPIVSLSSNSLINDYVPYISADQLMGSSEEKTKIEAPVCNPV